MLFSNIINTTRQHNGFTLAETLITLVIIGVIAAITIPNLINNHRRTEVETRLKSTYSIFANMFKAAEADYGTFGTWDLSEYTQQSSNASNILNSFMDKYMLRYLKITSDKTQTLKDFGYKKISNPNGSDFQSVTSTRRIITLANGTTFWIAMNGWNINNGNAVIGMLYIYTDINGSKKPNVLGKDIFVFYQLFVNGYPISMVGERSDTTCAFSSNNEEFIKNFIQQNKCTLATNKKTGVLTFTNFRQPRETILENCKKGNAFASQCGALIRLDSWKISDDYPWL